MTDDDVDPTVNVNPHGFLSYPTNHVYGFVVDPTVNVPLIISDLMTQDVGTEAISIYWGKAGVEELSPSGSNYGVTARIRRFFQLIGYEGEHLNQVERELGEGNALVGVSVNDETKRAVATVFHQHGGHAVRHYARWIIEDM